MGGGVHDRIGALPDGIGLCPLATVPARAEHGGGTVELARRLCGGIVRILRRLSEPPGGHRRPPVASGGWLGLSGGHGRRGARRNRGVARRNRALPARDSARKGWERWNWLAARAGASSEFYEGSPSRRGARRNRGVARRNRALPARDRARKGWERWNWLTARAGASSVPPFPAHVGTVASGQRPYSVVHPAAHGVQRGRATLRRPPASTGGLPAARRAFVKF